MIRSARGKIASMNWDVCPSAVNPKYKSSGRLFFGIYHVTIRYRALIVELGQERKGNDIVPGFSFLWNDAAESKRSIGLAPMLLEPRSDVDW